MLHLETELDRPIAPMRLEHEQFELDYQPVTFTGKNETVWLPQNADITTTTAVIVCIIFATSAISNWFRRGASSESEPPKSVGAKSPSP